MPVSKTLNKSRVLLGLSLRAWIAMAFAATTVFLLGFKMLAVFSFPMLMGGTWLMVRKHPKMFELWNLSFVQKAYHDPRKR